jgi:hypothetical protein
MTGAAPTWRAPGETPFERQYDGFDQAFEDATTLLENMFWSWMMGAPRGAELYLEELAITPLGGPGYLPDDFQGEP